MDQEAALRQKAELAARNERRQIILTEINKVKVCDPDIAWDGINPRPTHYNLSRSQPLPVPESEPMEVENNDTPSIPEEADLEPLHDGNADTPNIPDPSRDPGLSQPSGPTPIRIANPPTLPENSVWRGRLHEKRWKRRDPEFDYTDSESTNKRRRFDS